MMANSRSKTSSGVPRKKPGPKPGTHHAGTFKDGNAGGPGRGNKTPAQAAGLAIVEEMERGYTTAEQGDDPPGVKAARRLAHEDYPKFITMYLKAKELAGVIEPVERVVAEEVATADAGPKEERVETLIEQLLAEWGAEDAGPNKPPEDRADGSGRDAAGDLHGRGRGDDTEERAHFVP